MTNPYTGKPAVNQAVRDAESGAGGKKKPAAKKPNSKTPTTTSKQYSKGGKKTPSKGSGTLAEMLAKQAKKFGE